jgi:hypothetical protein
VVVVAVVVEVHHLVEVRGQQEHLLVEDQVVAEEEVAALVVPQSDLDQMVVLGVQAPLQVEEALVIQEV